MQLSFLIILHILNFNYFIQVGACIVNEENKVVGIGYNGMPLGFIDANTNWGKDDKDGLPNKDPIGNSGFVASTSPPLKFSNGKTDPD